MHDLVLYGTAVLAVAALWILGLIRLDVFTPDDVRAFRRLADLRGYARPTSRIDRVVSQTPMLRRLQTELDLERLLAIAGRADTPTGFLGRTISLSLAAFALVVALDALGRASASDWPISLWYAPLAFIAVFLARLVQLRASARTSQAGVTRTLGDSLMSVAILSDSRGLQVHDALLLLSRCAADGSLERLLEHRGWARLVKQPSGSTQELYRRIGSAYGVRLLTQIADAETAARVGVPEREVYTRLAESVYRERLADARSRGARAKVLVTLPVAAMLIPLLLLLGAPTLVAITTGLQGG